MLVALQGLLQARRVGDEGKIGCATTEILIPVSACCPFWFVVRFFFLDALIHSWILQDDDMEYEKLAKAMVFDLKAKPGERTKTAEEIAEAEKKRLEKLEVRVPVLY